MNVHSDKKITHKALMSEKEAQIIAGALERLRGNWDKIAKTGEIELFVTAPGTGEDKRVRINKKELDTLGEHFNYIIEGL